MAVYTWDQVQKAIADNGLFFNDTDLYYAQKDPDWGMEAVQHKLDYKNAETDDQKAMANAALEHSRSTHWGYTSGSEGKGFYLNDPSPKSFSYQQPGTGSGTGGTQSSAAQTSEFKNPYADQQKTALDKVMNQKEWENPYSDQQKAAFDAVVNREAFSYDPNQDVAWQNARKQYLREADRATQDTMGQAAALTGGMPSTAAMAAAQQAGDYYRGQLNDRMADYQNMAYDRYLNDANLNFGTLDAINNMSESDYQKYWDNVGLGFDQLSAINSMSQQARSEYDTDRNFAYNQWTDELGFQSDKQQTKYEQEQYAREYADSSNDNLAKMYLSLYDDTQDSKYLDMALERIAQLGK